MTRRNPFADGTPAPPAGPEPSGGSGVDGSAPDQGGGAGGERPLGARMRAFPDVPKDAACARLPLTDLGNAERWRVRFGDAFRFCPEIGWFAWDGRRWALLSEEKDRVPAEVMQSVFLTVRAIRNEAALVAATSFAPPTEPVDDETLSRFERWADAFGAAERDTYLRGDDGTRAAAIDALEPMDVVLGVKKKEMWSHKIAAWAKTSEGAGKLNAVAGLIKSFPEVAIRPELLDRDLMAINVLNGTLRLERLKEKRPQADIEAGKSEWRTTGWRIRLHKHDRADLLTKLSPIKWSPNARCPEYDAFLERMQPDAAMRRFLNQWGGYSLTGDTTEHKLAFFYGEGRNGKGTWVEAVAHLAGDYAGAIGIESLLDTGQQRRGDQATPDLAELPAVRFLRVSEPKKGMAWNDGLIKQLTGGDPVKARHLNKGFFTYFPHFKMTISGNTKPNVRDLSHGMWARMQLVPWNVVLQEDQLDRDLPARLKAEGSGILNRLLEGLIDWRTNGLIVPDAVKDATRAYRDQSDVLGRFLAQCCVIGDDGRRVRVKASELWETFEAWAQATGSPEWKRTGFVNAMKERRFEQIVSNGVYWVKVALRDGVSAQNIRDGLWSDPGQDDEIGEIDLPPGFD